MAIGNFLEKMAYDWARSEAPEQIKDEYYCATRDVFQARLDSMVSFLLAGKVAEGDAYMLAAIAGEIGNNSFDHNLGSWPDVPGIFFGYGRQRRQQNQEGEYVDQDAQRNDKSQFFQPLKPGKY